MLDLNIYKVIQQLEKNLSDLVNSITFEFPFDAYVDVTF